MAVQPSKIEKLLQAIECILEVIYKAEAEHRDAIDNVCPAYKKSARNLVHYNALRSHDVRNIQKKLGNLGISRLANAQGHIEASLLNIHYLLNSLVHQAPVTKKSVLSLKVARNLLAKHTKELLGYRSKNRRVRIMVTQPTAAADNYPMVLSMVKNGMNCARINCAHDSPEVWKKIILNVKKASKYQGKKVKTCMDLAGPKIRTGKMKPGARVKKFKPRRDELGKVITPALIMLKSAFTGETDHQALPVDGEWLSQLRVGDCLHFRDTRGKKRKMIIEEVSQQKAQAACGNTCYIGTGTELSPERRKLNSVPIGLMPAAEQYILLRPGDLIIIHQSDEPGEPALLDHKGNIEIPAHIGCAQPEVYESIKKGEPVLFDDGKIEGVIVTCESDHFAVRITRAKESGSRLRADKGINFPTTDLRISGLTAKDRDDLAFIAEHADVVNFSFVNSGKDVEQLLAALEQLEVRGRLSIILKIETRKSFDNLTEILLTAMKTQYIGVMIARGDLAVETGWDNIGRIQKEILSICNAAHVPVVWATQVLENLAKKGLPSRSEITDATSSLKAECVMLNKGNYINAAIKLLDQILIDMENLKEKNESMLPRMERFSAP